MIRIAISVEAFEAIAQTMIRHGCLKNEAEADRGG
jgi:hypothetical protein